MSSRRAPTTDARRDRGAPRARLRVELARVERALDGAYDRDVSLQIDKVIAALEALQ